MYRILIPLITLAGFCWLAWYSLQTPDYDIQGLNELTLAMTCDDWLCELERKQ